MTILTLPDLAALVWFIVAWIAYSIVIEGTAKGRAGLNALMNAIATNAWNVFSNGTCAWSMRRSRQRFKMAPRALHPRV